MKSEPSANLSVNVVLEAFRIPRPIRIQDVVAGLEPINLQSSFHDASCEGSCSIVISHDGRVSYSGHVHNGGVLDARYMVITSIPTLTVPVLIAHQSSAGGTVGLDKRRDDWDLQGFSSEAASDWWSFRAATEHARTDFGASTGAFEVVSSLFGAVLAGAAAGEVIFHL